jgi:hypothetical protein
MTQNGGDNDILTETVRDDCGAGGTEGGLTSTVQKQMRAFERELMQACRLMMMMSGWDAAAAAVDCMNFYPPTRAY